MVHKSAFPFGIGTHNDYMHKKVVEKIRDPEFSFQLPPLSNESWKTICEDKQESERLEFVGDALMSDFVAQELYRIYNDVSPHFYTNTRSVLTANSTFAHLMHKVAFHNLNDPVKPAGDAFETIIAAFYKECGHDAFHGWIKQFFRPLIYVVGLAYRNYRNGHLQRRKINHINSGLVRVLDRARTQHFHRKHLSVCKPVVIPPLSRVVHPALQRLVWVGTMIDLTIDSDWEDVDDSEDDGIQEIPSDLFYRTKIALATSSVKVDGPPTALSSHTQQLLRTISHSLPPFSPPISAPNLLVIPSTPKPASRDRDTDIQQLAAHLQRTPMLGTSANPITLD
ncbi:hypothetical protein BDQ12DRAFT_711037 [Crucibulum laeve]|uniref:RNase III domain-containing protein n=1 Tax=Crucibulum laeve TaxID=68775 RepID=A0A5C3MJ81_9AGAR|nr:hypothetical protein BDQ12DRAFT_711037 [Crucibulum laeve]